MPPTKKTAPVEIDLKQMSVGLLDFTLEGDTALIVHRWSEKAKKEILDKQMKKAAKGREAKDPKKDYEDSLYVMNGSKRKEYGFPAIAFKKAAIDAISQVAGLTKVQMRGAFHVCADEGDLVRIKGKPRMREDMVRVGMGTADIRYRGEFPAWSVDLTVRYNKDVVSQEQIINLFNLAGFAVGVGEARPQKNGQFGMFHVRADKRAA